MTTAPDPQVTDELLSAYIDEAVSEDERRLIESAVAHDPQIAWRLESLRATVRLLHELPALALPRSFVLTPEQVNGAAPGPVRRPAGSVAPNGAPARREANQRRQADADTGGGFWQELWLSWGRFWQAGSPALRNAMAASFAVLLALLIAPRFLAPPTLPNVGSVQTAAAPAGESSAVIRDAETGSAEAGAEAGNTGTGIAGAVAPAVAVQGEAEAGAARQAPGAAQPEAATATNTTTSPETGASPKLANTGASEPASAPASEPSGAVAGSAASAAETADTETFAAPAGVAAAAPAAAAPAAAAPAAAAPANAAPAAAAPANAAPAEGASADAVLVAPAPGQPAPVLEEGAPVMEGAGSGGGSAIDDMQMAGGSAPAPAAVPAAPASARAIPTAAETGVALESAAAEAAPVQSAVLESASSVTEAATEAADVPDLAAADVAQPVQAEATVAAEGTVQAEATPALALPVFALLAAAATVIFAALWWRSRIAQ